MIRAWRVVGAMFLAAAVFCGCGQQAVQEKTYEVNMPSGLDQAKQILRQYVDGAPLGSEVTSFPEIIEEVKQTDPQKAEILDRGLTELQQSSTGPAAKAKALLEELQ